MSAINLKVLTPEDIIFEGSVDKIVVNTASGEVGILPGHVKLLTTVKAGALKITQTGKDQTMAIGAGMLRVQENSATLLTDMALEAKDIDEKAAEDARVRAQNALADKTLSDEEYATTLAMLEKSLAQLHLKRRHRSP